MPEVSDAKKEQLIQRTMRMIEATVDEVMTTDVITCDADDLCAKAARLIMEHGILGILVMKQGRAHTMLTNFDLLKLGYEEVFDPERDYLKITVGQLVGDKPLISIPPGTKLREALNVMIENRMRTIPVIEDGKVFGILSLLDMTRWYRDTHDEVRTGRI